MTEKVRLLMLEEHEDKQFEDGMFRFEKVMKHN